MRAREQSKIERREQREGTRVRFSRANKAEIANRDREQRAVGKAKRWKTKHILLHTHTSACAHTRTQHTHTHAHNTLILTRATRTNTQTLTTEQTHNVESDEHVSCA